MNVFSFASKHTLAHVGSFVIKLFYYTVLILCIEPYNSMPYVHVLSFVDPDVDPGVEVAELHGQSRVAHAVQTIDGDTIVGPL